MTPAATAIIATARSGSFHRLLVERLALVKMAAFGALSMALLVKSVSLMTVC